MPLVWQIGRFGLVGIAATITHYAVLTGLVELLEWPAAVATGAAFLVALNVTYLGQAAWVFPGSERSRGQTIRFIATAVGGLVLNVAIMALLADVAGWPYQAAFAVAVVTVPALTFVVNKLWVFSTART